MKFKLEVNINLHTIASNTFLSIIFIHVFTHSLSFYWFILCSRTYIEYEKVFHSFQSIVTDLWPDSELCSCCEEFHPCFFKYFSRFQNQNFIFVDANFGKVEKSETLIYRIFYKFEECCKDMNCMFVKLPSSKLFLYAFVFFR